MVTDDLATFTQDEKYFGENVARTKRIIGKLLLDWTTSPEVVIQDDAVVQRPRPPHLNAIAFDKLSELFCRIWEQLNKQAKTRFPPAFKRRRGFHGPGRAIRINRKEDESLGVDPSDHRRNEWAFTTEIIEKLKPALGNARMIFVVKGVTWQSTCKVSPAIDPTQWESWLNDGSEAEAQGVFLTSIELTYVEEISKVISCLTSKELRILGTHHCPYETVEDLKFNLKAWANQFDKLVNGSAKNAAVASAYRLVTTMREIKAKSIDNRVIYRNALEKVLRTCTSTEIRNALHSTQNDDATIWEDPIIKRFRLIATALVNFSIYVRRGFSEFGVIPKLNMTEEAEADKIYKTLIKPVPNVTLNLPHYDNLQNIGLREWVKAIRGAKETLCAFLPILDDRDEVGIP